MTVTFNPQVRTGRRKVRMSWTSDQMNPTYYVYVRGVLRIQLANSIELTIADGETPVIQVLDDANTIPATFYPDHVLLQALRPTGTYDYLRVDQYIDSEWTEIDRQIDEGKRYPSYKTGPLADDTNHQFRFVFVGTNGNEGTAVSWSFLMVRRPDPPVASYSLDEGTGAITVTIA